jgi:predicted aspartyl protease
VLRTILIAAVAAALTTGPAGAACTPAPPSESYAFADAAAAPATAAGPTRDDGAGRIVAPVMVNGQGPYRFIVDTGANRSVLSPRLAERLGLISHAQGQVHSVSGVASAPLVRIESLDYGALALSAGEIPILGGGVLAGEHGLLGVDGMVGRMLLLDFEHQCIEIMPSRSSARMRGRNWTMMHGELRFGHLIVVHGRIDGVDVNVLLDTGSDTSLANTALLEAIRARRARRGERADRANTANETIDLDRAIIVQRIELAGLEARDVTAFVGDYHIFALWGLLEAPTILLGMDVISQTDALAIDYGRRTVHFRISRRGR